MLISYRSAVQFYSNVYLNLQGSLPWGFLDPNIWGGLGVGGLSKGGARKLARG